MRVELVLTEIAPVRGIGTVLRTGHLLGLNDEVLESKLLGDTARNLAMAFRVTGTISSHAQHARAGGPVSGVGEIGTVDAAAVGDDERWQLTQDQIGGG